MSWNWEQADQVGVGTLRPGEENEGDGVEV